MSYKVYEECKVKPKYFFCFICMLVSRLVTVLFSVYMQLWIISFEKSGVLSGKEESDAIYRNIVLGSQIAVLVTMPVFGFLADKADLRVIIPMTFFARCLIAGSFRFITNPNDWHSYVLSVLMIVISIVQFLSVEVIFMRNMSGQIRGTLSGAAFFFGSIGTTAFALGGGIMFDKIGPWAPFMLVSGADLVILVISLVFICGGFIKRDD